MSEKTVLAAAGLVLCLLMTLPLVVAVGSLLQLVANKRVVRPFIFFLAAANARLLIGCCTLLLLFFPEPIIW